MKLKPVSWAVACALCAPAAWAAESGDQALPEMTVSQSRPTVAIDNPSPQAGVTQEEIRQINVINVEDALKYAPSLQIRKRYIGDRNSIIAARTTGTTQSARSLVYADGLLLSNLLGNSFGFPPRWNMVGAEEIESIDVLYGPFSALLPGNSAGATVLMTTRRPEKFEAHARAQVFSQDFKLYGTDKTFDGHQEQATLGGRTGNLSWSLFANHIDSYGQPMSFAVNPTVSAGAGGKTVAGYQTDTDSTGASRVVIGATSLDHTVQDVAKVRVAYDFTPDTRAAFTYARWRNDSFSDTQTYLRDSTTGALVWSGLVRIGSTRYNLPASTFAPTDRNEENSLTGLTLDSRLAPDWRLELAASDYDTLTDITRTPTEAPAGGQPGSAGGKGNITFADGTGWRNFDAKAIWKPEQGKAGHAVTFGYHWDEYRIRSRQLSATNWRSDESTTTTSNRFSGNTSGAVRAGCVEVRPALDGHRWPAPRALAGIRRFALQQHRIQGPEWKQRHQLRLSEPRRKLQLAQAVACLAGDERVDIARFPGSRLPHAHGQRAVPDRNPERRHRHLHQRPQPQAGEDSGQGPDGGGVGARRQPAAVPV